MADELWGTHLTDMWMTNPYMFDPTQQSNQFSQYNNQRIPYPGSYSGVPTDAQGRPIQSFQQWQQQNPGGVSLNATPQQPQAPSQISPYSIAPGNSAIDAGNMSAGLKAMNSMIPTGNNSFMAGPGTPPGYWQAQSPQGAQAAQAAPQAAAPPNNWQAALNALSNPGRVTTPGATVPLQQGSQPAGGVNQAWLQGIGSGQGMNQNFVNALRNIQGR